MHEFGSWAILALDHVRLAMPAGGEEQARSFYAGLLGMQEIPKPGSLQASGGVWFSSDYGDSWQRLPVDLGRVERDMAVRFGTARVSQM